MNLSTNFRFVINFVIVVLIGCKHLTSGEDNNNNGFYPGYVGALNDTIENLMTQLKVYQQYIDQAFQPLNKYDKIFKKPIDNFHLTVTEEPHHKVNKTLEIIPSLEISKNESSTTVIIPNLEPHTPENIHPTVDSFQELLSSISSELEKNETTKTNNIITAEDGKSELPIPSQENVDNIPSSINFDSSIKYDHQIDDRVEQSKLSNNPVEESDQVKTLSSTNYCGIFNPSLMSGSHKRDHILWPWMVSIGKQYKSGFLYTCGGTIVHSRFIITSAHCFQKGDINTVDIAGTKISISRIIIHPEYKENIGYNDIAIVELTKAIELNSRVSSVCLPPYSQDILNIMDKVDSFSWSSEWKHKNDDGVLKMKIKNVHTKILNSTFCEEEIKDQNIDFQVIFPKGMDHSLLCVKSSRGRLCQGNAGISLLTRDKTGRSFLIGIIVKGEESCGENGDVQLPSIYTRISKFSDWIQQIISFTK